MNTILSAIVHIVSKPALSVIIDDTPAERRRRIQVGDMVHVKNSEFEVIGIVHSVHRRGCVVYGNHDHMPYPARAHEMTCKHHRSNQIITLLRT